MKMFILLCLTTFIAQLFSPWWIVFPIALLISYLFNKRSWQSFILCFIAVYCVWALYSLYISWGNDHILGNRIGVLFGFPESNKNWFWMVFISGLPGAIVAGLAGLSGQYIRKVF